ncbi:acyltransferase family protein [Brevundimonas bacteroides]|uniref:acyltransferase family protein n=1 Tax=Brevundimonas bacteroides TaxID=74311 RepID=UPI0004974E55|nr:acyltransferase [Brevundimonas bacteroides]
MRAQGDQAIIPEVQGLRGVTACAVVLFHMGWLWCGWLGVWVFFTLSGFVITRSLLRAEAAGESYTPVRFYRARATRILPLYFAAIGLGVASLSVEAWVFERPDALDHLTDVPWLLTGTYNVLRAFPGYDQTQLFGHLWSLSVEEQFYLLFPLAFLGLRRRMFAGVMIGLVVVGPLLRVVLHLALTAAGWSSGDTATAVYMLTFSHLDAFALGAVIALNEERLKAMAGTVAARRLTLGIAIALTAIALVCVALQNFQVQATGKDVLTDAFAVKPELLSGQVVVYAFAVAVAGGLLVLILTGSRLVAVLASDSLVRLGTVSFSLYVWHFPLLWIYAGAGKRSLVAAVIYIAATIAAALLSHRYLEQPARRWLEARWRDEGVRPRRSPTSAAQSPARL